MVRPSLRQVSQDKSGGVIAISHPDLGERFCYAEGASALLFTENETNKQRLFGTPNPSPYVKDGINDFIVHGKQDAINPEKKGTKVVCPLLAHDRRRRIAHCSLAIVRPAIEP